MNTDNPVSNKRCITLVVILGSVLGLTQACSVTDPHNTTDNTGQFLPIIHVSPDRIVAQEVFIANPDSSNPIAPFDYRFTLSNEAIDALANGAVLEAVLLCEEQPYIWFSTWGYLPSNDSWEPMSPVISAQSDWGWGELWWLEAWWDPALGRRLVTGDGKVWLRTEYPIVPDRSWIRVFWFEEDYWHAEHPGGLMTEGDGYLFILDTSHTLYRLEPESWAEVICETHGLPLWLGDQIPLRSICYIDGYIYGADCTDLYRVQMSGGVWEHVATMPFTYSTWPVHIESDGTDLFVLAHHRNKDQPLPILYRVDVQLVITESNLTEGIVDWCVINLERREGYNFSGVFVDDLIWNEHLQLFATRAWYYEESMESVAGFALFDRDGEFSKFIEMPYTVEQCAFINDWAFTFGGRPYIEILGWSVQSTPVRTPRASWISRWNINY